MSPLFFSLICTEIFSVRCQSKSDPCYPPYYPQVLKPCHLPSSPSPSSICHSSLRAGRVRARVHPPSPSFVTLHLDAACAFLWAPSFSPDILGLLTMAASERICYHLCIPAIIFWRFSPSQWKTECVWRLKEISLMPLEWQLWQAGCIFSCTIYKAYFFLIGFEGY